jgi:hypothetical protein
MVNLYFVFAGIYGISGSLFGFLRELKFHYDIAINPNLFSGYDGLDKPDIDLSRVLFNSLTFTLIGTGFLFGIVGVFYDLSTDNLYSWIFSVSEILIVFLYGFDVYVTRDKKLLSRSRYSFISIELLVFYFIFLVVATFSIPRVVNYVEFGVFLFIFVIIAAVYLFFKKMMGSKKKDIIT